MTHPQLLSACRKQYEKLSKYLSNHEDNYGPARRRNTLKKDLKQWLKIISDTESKSPALDEVLKEMAAKYDEVEAAVEKSLDNASYYAGRKAERKNIDRERERAKLKRQQQDQERHRKKHISEDDITAKKISASAYGDGSDTRKFHTYESAKLYLERERFHFKETYLTASSDTNPEKVYILGAYSKHLGRDHGENSWKALAYWDGFQYTAMPIPPSIEQIQSSSFPLKSLAHWEQSLIHTYLRHSNFDSDTPLDTLLKKIHFIADTETPEELEYLSHVSNRSTLSNILADQLIELDLIDPDLEGCLSNDAEIPENYLTGTTTLNKEELHRLLLVSYEAGKEASHNELLRKHGNSISASTSIETDAEPRKSRTRIFDRAIQEYVSTQVSDQEMPYGYEHDTILSELMPQPVIEYILERHSSHLYRTTLDEAKEEAIGRAHNKHANNPKQLKIALQNAKKHQSFRKRFNILRAQARSNINGLL